MHRSRTGKRLAVFSAACPTASLWFDNCTSLVGAAPGSVVPTCPVHMASLLSRSWDGFVAFGRQAEEALASRGVSPLLSLPHPTYRLVTDALFVQAGKLLAQRLSSRIALRQRRGFTLLEKLDG